MFLSVGSWVIDRTMGEYVHDRNVELFEGGVSESLYVVGEDFGESFTLIVGFFARIEDSKRS